jgi:hypothetical protein
MADQGPCGCIWTIFADPHHHHAFFDVFFGLRKPQQLKDKTNQKSLPQRTTKEVSNALMQAFLC